MSSSWKRIEKHIYEVEMPKGEKGIFARIKHGDTDDNKFFDYKKFCKDRTKARQFKHCLRLAREWKYNKERELGVTKPPPFSRLPQCYIRTDKEGRLSAVAYFDDDDGKRYHKKVALIKHGYTEAYKILCHFLRENDVKYHYKKVLTKKRSENGNWVRNSGYLVKFYSVKKGKYVKIPEENCQKKLYKKKKKDGKYSIRYMLKTTDDDGATLTMFVSKETYNTVTCKGWRDKDD